MSKKKNKQKRLESKPVEWNQELEDIVKEFSVDEPPRQTQEDTAEAVSGDTIRLDKIQAAVTSPASETSRYQPVEEEEDAPYLPPVPEKEAVEPFSENWEPEYDAPMGDYTPPIAFKPKSRLQQLRAKLVAGPERKYYELSEKGFGKLQSGIFLSLVIFAAALFTTVLYAMGLVSPDRVKLLAYVQILCMLLSGLVGCYRMLDGLADILKLRFTLNTWLALSFLVCCVDGVLCLQQQRISCCAVFCLEILMAQLATYHKRTIQLEQMDVLRKAADLDALVGVEDYFGGKPGLATQPGEPEAFMENYEDPSLPEKILHWYSLISFLICGMFGLFGVLRDGLATGMQIMAGAMLLSMPATAFISMTRPEKLLSHRLHKLGVVLCGWKGIRAIPVKLAFPVRDADILPADTVKPNGMKFLGLHSPDTVVCYAASLVCAEGGSLAPVFQQMLSDRNGRLLPVENLQSLDGGLKGHVEGLPVVVGTMEFIAKTGVEIPKGTKVTQAVCISIEGELAGMFAMGYSRSRSTVAGLHTLCSYRSIQPVLADNDFLFTESFLTRHFKGNPKRLARPEAQVRSALAEKTPAEDAAPIALLTKPGLAPKAYAITGGKMLRTTWYLGVVIHLLGGILGLVAAAALTMVGAQDLLTPGNLLLYSLIWMVPSFLITQWTRIL